MVVVVVVMLVVAVVVVRLVKVVGRRWRGRGGVIMYVVSNSVLFTR